MTNDSNFNADRHLARGSAWMIGMRWAVRGLGLISTVVLARLLTPDDFGIVAMAMVVIAMLEVFTHFGTDLALLRRQELSRDYYDSAWTIWIFQGIGLSTALIIAAPFAAGYFKDPRVADVMRVLAIRPLIGGFQNVGVIDFRRNLNFAAEFRFGVSRKVLALLVTIGAAWAFRSYWALVLGQIASRAMEVHLSYQMSPFRPRVGTDRVRELWGFSQWLLMTRIAQLVARKVDELVVGRVAGTAMMGQYFVASDLATAPTAEVVNPASRALFPIYSRLASDPAALKAAFVKVLAGVAYLCAAAGAGMTLVSTDLVQVLLGSQWSATSSVLGWLAAYGAMTGLATVFETYLLVIGRERRAAGITVASAVLMVAGLVMAGMSGGATLIATVKAGVALVFACVVCTWGTRGTAVSASDAGRAVIWPVLSAAAMAAVVLAVREFARLELPVLRLALDVLVGAAAFVAAATVLWWMRGRPPGFERDALGLAGRLLGRTRRRGR